MKITKIVERKEGWYECEVLIRTERCAEWLAERAAGNRTKRARNGFASAKARLIKKKAPAVG